MGKPEPLYKALNFSSLMLGIGAVFGGNASAQLHGNAEFFPATICLLFVVFAQLTANAYHRYHALVEYHHLITAGGNQVPGSRALHDKILFYRVFSFGFGLIALMTGCTLVSMGGFWFGLVGAFILIASWAMVGGKSPLLLSTWGFVFTFILFGPVTVISTSMLQSLHEASDPLSWFDISPSLYMGAVIGFLAANAYLLYVYGAYFNAKKVMHYTFPALYGRRATRNLFLFNSIAASGIFIWSCFALAVDKPWIGIIPGLLCLLLNIYIWRKMATLPKYKLPELATLGCLNVLLMGIGASIATIWVGIPDDSIMQLF